MAAPHRMHSCVQPACSAQFWALPGQKPACRACCSRQDRPMLLHLRSSQTLSLFTHPAVVCSPASRLITAALQVRKPQRCATTRPAASKSRVVAATQAVKDARIDEAADHAEEVQLPQSQIYEPEHGDVAAQSAAIPKARATKGRTKKSQISSPDPFQMHLAPAATFASDAREASQRQEAATKPGRHRVPSPQGASSTGSSSSGSGDASGSGQSVIWESDMVGEGSRMNPVYRMIRKTELQMRRAGAGSPSSSREDPPGLDASETTESAVGWAGPSKAASPVPSSSPKQAPASSPSVQPRRFSRVSAAPAMPFDQRQEQLPSMTGMQSGTIVAGSGSSSVIKESEMATEGARLNPVYRLIRKQELRMRKGLGSGFGPASGSSGSIGGSAGSIEDVSPDEDVHARGYEDLGSDPVVLQAGAGAGGPGGATEQLHLSSEKSRLNPVYRLIRKTELQRRRAPSPGPSTAPGSAAATAAPTASSQLQEVESLVQESEMATEGARLNPVYRLIRKKELERRRMQQQQQQAQQQLEGALSEGMLGLDPFGPAAPFPFPSASAPSAPFFSSWEGDAASSAGPASTGALSGYGPPGSPASPAASGLGALLSLSTLPDPSFASSFDPGLPAPATTIQAAPLAPPPPLGSQQTSRSRSAAAGRPPPPQKQALPFTPTGIPSVDRTIRIRQIRLSQRRKQEAAAAASDAQEAAGPSFRTAAAAGTRPDASAGAAELRQQGRGSRGRARHAVPQQEPAQPQQAIAQQQLPGKDAGGRVVQWFQMWQEPSSEGKKTSGSSSYEPGQPASAAEGGAPGSAPGAARQLRLQRQSQGPRPHDHPTPAAWPSAATAFPTAAASEATDAGPTVDSPGTLELGIAQAVASAPEPVVKRKQRSSQLPAAAAAAAEAPDALSEVQALRPRRRGPKTNKAKAEGSGSAKSSEAFYQSLISVLSLTTPAKAGPSGGPPYLSGVTAAGGGVTTGAVTAGHRRDQAAALEAVQRLLALQPSLMGRDPTTLVENLTSLSVTLGVPHQRVAEAVTRYPPLMELAPHTTAARFSHLVALLTQAMPEGQGVRALDVAEAVCECPALLGTAPATLDLKMGALARTAQLLVAAAAATAPETGATAAVGGGGGPHSVPGECAVSAEAWALSARLLLAFPALGRVAPGTVSSKAARLAAAASTCPLWARDLRHLLGKPKTLARCLAASHGVLDRLAYLGGSNTAASLADASGTPEPASSAAATATGKRWTVGNFGLSHVLVSSAAVFAEEFPGFGEWQGSHGWAVCGEEGREGEVFWVQVGSGLRALSGMHGVGGGGGAERGKSRELEGAGEQQEGESGGEWEWEEGEE